MKTYILMIFVFCFSLSGFAEGKIVKAGIFNPDLKIDRGLTCLTVYKNLQQLSGIEVGYVKELTIDTLSKYDVVIFSCVHLVGTQPTEWKDNIRSYVEIGGSVILTHDSCGFAHALSPSLFPELFKPTGRSVNSDFFLTDEAKKLLNFSADSVKFTYFQYVVMEKGPEGIALAKDSSGAVCAAAGYCGAGKVVGIGALADGWDKPTAQETEFMAACIRWAGDKKTMAKSPEEMEKLLRKNSAELLILRKQFDRLSSETAEQLNDLYNQVQYMKYGGKLNSQNEK